MTTTTAKKRKAAPKRELISRNEYARRRGLHHSSVDYAVHSGRISTVGGKINPEKADREWLENTDQSKPRNRITGDPKHRRATGQVPKPMGASDSGGSNGGRVTATGYQKYRIDREKQQARIARLDADRKDGLLILASEVRRGAFDMARKTRDQLLALGERLATMLPPETQSMLKEEIERLCQELSDAERP